MVSSSNLGLGSSLALAGQRFLRATQRALSQHLEQLSTGFRINRGGDDPAGLIASENLGAEAARLEAEIRSGQRADAVASVAEGALAEISAGVGRAQALAVANANTAGFSLEERAANQFEIDHIVANVNRIANTTTFAGTRLFDGNLVLDSGANRLAVPMLSSSRLGQLNIGGVDHALSSVVGGGPLDTVVPSNISAASQVIETSVADVAVLRGQFGAFQRELRASLQVKGRTFESLVASRAQIRETDFASASAGLLRTQILSRAAFYSALAVRSAFSSTVDLLSVVGRPRDLTPSRPTQDAL